jgi:hypothetical protein
MHNSDNINKNDEIIKALEFFNITDLDIEDLTPKQLRKELEKILNIKLSDADIKLSDAEYKIHKDVLLNPNSLEEIQAVARRWHYLRSVKNKEEETKKRFSSKSTQSEMDQFRDLFEDVLLNGVIDKTQFEASEVSEKLKVVITEPQIPSIDTIKRSSRDDKSIYIQVSDYKIGSQGMMKLLEVVFGDVLTEEAEFGTFRNGKLDNMDKGGVRITENEMKQILNTYNNLTDDEKEKFKNDLNEKKALMQGKEPLLTYLMEVEGVVFFTKFACRVKLTSKGLSITSLNEKYKDNILKAIEDLGLKADGVEVSSKNDGTYELHIPNKFLMPLIMVLIMDL